ncbi:Permease [Candidatus Sulfotelmatobacter kueseliae]|uniref:Permease n=1 Tax=Candidatus Sulfotelmatobacter kueseliae TaxID=2042962 RepID=A0A2U3KQ74_9BACT|nr:Permease [Candidatus Sulfotelmatobacter kueseliae]
MSGLIQDVRYALRQLRRDPGFTMTVVITLALSIGANTAIFSVVNALLLKSLPYTHPERMGTIYTRVTGSGDSDDRTGIDGEKWELLRDGVPALISAVSGGTSGVNLQAGSRVQYVHDGRISAHYLDVLALQPLLGRNFSEDEDRPHGPKAAILSYGQWHSVFSDDRTALGQPILLRGEPYTLVGVLPQDATTPLNADVYTSLQPSREGEGGGTNFEAITRLRDGATWQEADAEINRAWALLAQRIKKDAPGAQVTYYSVPLQKGQTEALRPQVLALMLAAGFILLIACANLAGLALVRMLRRTPEVATRLALGASSWQIQKQFWVENLLLALVGGGVAIGVGFLALRGILLLLPEHFLPVAGVPLDTRVMAFTLAISVLTSVLFGMLPALVTRRVDLRSSMASRAVAGWGKMRLRQALIAGEVSLTVVLLAASGLLIRSLIHLETLPPGFNPNGLMIAKASLDDARYHDPAAFRQLLNESTAAMRQIPGVQNAAVGLSLPYETALNDGVTLSDGKEAGQEGGTDVVYVTPGYFDTLQMPLLAGRVFTDADGSNAQHVAVVNQAFARKFYGGTNPVGRYINKDTLIVGEVADVPLSSNLYPVAPLMSEQTTYIPAAQVKAGSLSLVHVWFQPDWVVRTAGPVEGLTVAMQRALTRADPNLPTSGFYRVNDLMARTLATQRIEVALLGAMATLALLLSAVGIFALVANIVAERTREIGIRMALGSTVGKAMTEVGRAGAGASLLGVVLGLGLSAGALRTMGSVLYGIGVYDVPTICVVISVLASVAFIASTVPTFRIARINPAQTLRDE